jgi:hypothetical protein
MRQDTEPPISHQLPSRELLGDSLENICRASRHFGDKVCNNKIGNRSVQLREPIAKKSNLPISS